MVLLPVSDYSFSNQVGEDNQQDHLHAENYNPVVLKCFIYLVQMNYLFKRGNLYLRL